MIQTLLQPDPHLAKDSNRVRTSSMPSRSTERAKSLLEWLHAVARRLIDGTGDRALRGRSATRFLAARMSCGEPLKAGPTSDIVGSDSSLLSMPRVALLSTLASLNRLCIQGCDSVLTFGVPPYMEAQFTTAFSGQFRSGRVS